MALNWIKTWLEYLRPWVLRRVGNRTPTVHAQDKAFVSIQEWKNVKTKKLTQNVKRETGENSGKYPSQDAGLAPKVDYFARDEGTILADRYDGVEADEMTFNITLEKTS